MRRGKREGRAERRDLRDAPTVETDEMKEGSAIRFTTW
jgi:hypothetical protein